MQLLTTADQGTAHPWAVIGISQPTSPTLFTGYDILWYGIFFWSVCVSWPGYGHPQLLVQLVSGMTWETGKFFTWGKHNLATPENVINMILILNPKHSTVPATRKKITFSQPKAEHQASHQVFPHSGKTKKCIWVFLGQACVLSSRFKRRNWWGKSLTSFQDTIPNCPCSGKWKPRSCLQHLVSAKLKLVMFLLLDALPFSASEGNRVSKNRNRGNVRWKEKEEEERSRESIAKT